MAKPGPFPGMDPWIEPVWRPFHNDYIGYLRRQVAAQLPDDLYAQTEADVFVVDNAQGRGPSYVPDVATVDRSRTAGHAASTAGGAVALIDTPILARPRRRPEVVRHVAIREPRNGHRLVTAIELFSPTNKVDPHERAAYRDKRDGYLRASANVVEIDLLRRGPDLMDLEPDDLPTDPAAATYRACVRFASPDVADWAEYYPVPLRSRLPRVSVPLRPGDPDVTLDLQQAFTDVYDVGRYDLQLDYAVPPAPPLPPADAAWAAERVAAAGVVLV